MKSLMTIAILSAAAAGTWAEETPGFDAVGLVHLDEANVDTYYNYLAAVPVFRYWNDVRFSKAPLFTDEPTAADAIGEENPTALRLIVIGDADPAKITAVREAFDVAPNAVVTVQGDAAVVAATLATNWAQARDVVVAPYAPGGDKAAVASASYAAALASVLNAPLVYTYTKHLPYETSAALRSLGAKNVYLVDLGASCSGYVLEKLTADGRYLRAAFGRAGDVTAFVEKYLHGQQMKSLPRPA